MSESSRLPVKTGDMYIRIRCLVQDNGDGTTTVSVPRLSAEAWTGASEAEARYAAMKALDDQAPSNPF